MTIMVLPHAVIIEDDDCPHGMPPLSPLALACDPGLDGPARMEIEAELIAVYTPEYGLEFARDLLLRARALRQVEQHESRR